MTRSVNCSMMRALTESWSLGHSMIRPNHAWSAVNETNVPVLRTFSKPPRSSETSPKWSRSPTLALLSAFGA